MGLEPMCMKRKVGELEPGIAVVEKLRKVYGGNEYYEQL